VSYLSFLLVLIVKFTILHFKFRSFLPYHSFSYLSHQGTISLSDRCRLVGQALLPSAQLDLHPLLKVHCATVAMDPPILLVHLRHWSVGRVR